MDYSRISSPPYVPSPPTKGFLEGWRCGAWWSSPSVLLCPQGWGSCLPLERGNDLLLMNKLPPLCLSLSSFSCMSKAKRPTIQVWIVAVCIYSISFFNLLFSPWSGPVLQPRSYQSLMLDLWWPRKYHRAEATHFQRSCGKYLQWNLLKVFPVYHFPVWFFFPVCGFARLCSCVCIWINGHEWTQSACRNGLCLENIWKFTFSIYPFHRNYPKKQSLGCGDDTKCNRNTLKKNTQKKEGAFLQLSVFMGVPCCISHYMLSQ